MRRRSRGWLLVAASVLFGCASHRVASVPPPMARPSPRSTLPTPAEPGATVRGLASWYGRAHHGRATASGERFDMHALTAAHPTLPFGTLLLVTNPANGRSVEVRINDRGPVVADRTIDLSFAAARALGATGDGVFPVMLRVLSTPGGEPRESSRAPSK
jgi:rare lipoprotein A